MVISSSCSTFSPFSSPFSLVIHFSIFFIFLSPSSPFYFVLHFLVLHPSSFFLPMSFTSLFSSSLFSRVLHPCPNSPSFSLILCPSPHFSPWSQVRSCAVVHKAVIYKRPPPCSPISRPSSRTPSLDNDIRQGPLRELFPSSFWESMFVTCPPSSLPPFLFSPYSTLPPSPFFPFISFCSLSTCLSLSLFFLFSSSYPSPFPSPFLSTSPSFSPTRFFPNFSAPSPLFPSCLFSEN